MIQITLKSIRCDEETNEVGSDEPYLIIATADYTSMVSVAGFPIPIPTVEVVRFGPFDDVDTGETHRPSIPSRNFWGPAGVPRNLTNPDDAIIVVALLENDSGDPEATRGIVSGLATSSVFASLSLNRSQRVASLINEVNSGSAIPTGFPNFDDRIGRPQELRFSRDELRRIESGDVIDKQLLFRGDGGQYTLTFTAKPSGDESGNAIIVTIDFDGRDDETFRSDEIFDPRASSFRIVPGIQPDPVTFRWGGELRAEYTFESFLGSAGDHTLRCNCNLFEGNSTSTTDLDGSGSLDIVTTQRSVSTETFIVRNTDENEPDDFARLRISVQNNPPGMTSLFLLWNRDRTDNFLTTNATYLRPRDHSPDGYGFSQHYGHIFDPEEPMPAGTIPLISWWNPTRRDNRATSDPRWSGDIGTTLEGYRLYRVEGYIFDPRRPRPRGSIPLTSWWNSGRTDHFTTTKEEWQQPVGTVREGYRSFRLEGFVLEA